MRPKPAILAVAVVAVTAGVLLATGHFGVTAGGTGSSGGGAAGGRGDTAARITLRLGFVAEVTQASAMVGLRDGLFAAALRGSGVTLRPVAFRTDQAESAALAAGRLDAAYASPDAILAVLAAPHGVHISVISGAATGGAELVVRSGITSASTLRGRTLAVPSAGGSEDIGLRSWLASQHLHAAQRGGVNVTAVSPEAVVREFRAGRISGAWMPAPYDVELADAGGHVLASEAAGLASASRPAAVNLVVTRAFIVAHSAAIMALLTGQVHANDFLHQELIKSALSVNAELAAVTGKGLPTGVLEASLIQVTFTDDPAAASLAAVAKAAIRSGGTAVPAAALRLLYDLGPLNLILRIAGEPPVSA